MTDAAKTIKVEPGSELDRLLTEANTSEVVLEKDGVRYRLVCQAMPVEQDDIWAGYDPERALANLRAAAGGWQGLVDAEDFKRYIAERRRTANRPSRAR